MTTKQNARLEKVKEDFKKRKSNSEENYSVSSEGLSDNEKLEILDSMGRPELIDLFNDWKPRVSKRRKRGAPLDQRLAITVTDTERFSLDKELETLKKANQKISISQFIRNRAMSNIDLIGWKELAETALAEIEETFENKAQLIEERKGYELEMEAEDDTDVIAAFGIKVEQLNNRLNKITAQNEKRANRLTGRMTMTESEQVKWKAQRLCISTSDYLRMMIFALEPNSSADAHMSFDAKRRFYISIIEVAQNGWGNPPNIYECSQCENYTEEIERLQAEVKALRSF